MVSFFDLSSDEEKISALEMVLLSRYPLWREWIKSVIYCPFGTKNQLLIKHLLEGRTFKGLENVLDCKEAAIQVWYSHIMDQLSKEMTLMDYHIWLSITGHEIAANKKEKNTELKV